MEELPLGPEYLRSNVVPVGISLAVHLRDERLYRPVASAAALCVCDTPVWWFWCTWIIYSLWRWTLLPTDLGIAGTVFPTPPKASGVDLPLETPGPGVGSVTLLRWCWV